MTDEFRERFLEERARALATVVLTRRDDLTVAETNADTGLDYLVYLNTAGKPVRAMFGVQLKAGMSSVTPDHADDALGPAINALRRRGRFAYPVCLFYFTMREDQAFYSWVAEPVLTPDGLPKLVHHTRAHCRELNDEALDTLVGRVVSWYDALDAALITG